MEKFFLPLALLLFSGPVGAQVSGTLLEPLPERSLFQKKTFDFSSRYEWAQYSSEVESNPRLSQSSLVAARMNLELESLSTFSKVDFSAGRYTNWNNSYFAVQDLYSSYRWSPAQHQLSLGRKRLMWSQVDQDWQLGLWQPQAIVDGLDPLEQGLTGLFYEGELGLWSWQTYGSPLFIPTMNPPIAEKNGDLIAESRWVKAPSTEGNVLSRQTRLVYKISVPDMQKLVANPGAGVRLGWGMGRSQGLWASASAARKPINTLLVKYDSNLSVTNVIRGETELSPVVGYHTLVGFDLGFRAESSEWTVSYLSDRPESQKPTNELRAGKVTDWAQQQPGSLDILATRWKWPRLPLGFLSDRQKISVGYLRAQENPTIDFDSRGQERSSFFPNRLNFTNAVDFKISDSYFWGANELEIRFRYLRDFDQQGSLWSLLFENHWKKSWSVALGVDILGVDNDSLENSDTRFLNQYRANDRVYGGVSYVF